MLNARQNATWVAVGGECEPCMCSNCGKIIQGIYRRSFRFCPSCGKIMAKEEKEHGQFDT